MTTLNIRRIAAESLEQWEDGFIYAESLVEQAYREYQLTREDRNLLNAIILGVIRNQRLLDHWISQLRDGEIDIQVRSHLRVGLFQILILQIPDHAAVNETVNSARKGIRGLLNAILRGAIRQRDSLLAQVESLPPAIRYSHPDWLYDRWVAEFGTDHTLALMDWNQQPAHMIFRLNPLKSEALEIVANSSNVEPLPGHPGFFTSPSLPPKQWLLDGLIYIQDPATCHAVDLMQPQPGESILDACAAPGGKSTQIAAAMQNRGSLLCTDSNAKRLPRLLSNLENAGVTIANTDTCDWSQPVPKHLHRRFNAILLDVPCSNTGVLRKRVDARWRLTPESITELTTLQTHILENAIPCLLPGGRLIYSTCSIDPEENALLIQSFIAKHPQFTLTKQEIISPSTHQTDGAYAALLTYNGE